MIANTVLVEGFNPAPDEAALNALGSRAVVFAGEQVPSGSLLAARKVKH